MAGLSFTSSGAVPNLGIQGFGSSPNFGTQTSTPQSMALNNAQSRPYIPPQPATPAPQTPVKSTTVTHPDGTSIATTYHPPEPTSGLINSSTGKSNQQVLDESTTAAKTAQGVLDASKATPQPSPTTFGGVVSGLANASANGSQNATQATTGLLNSPQQNQVYGDRAQQIGDAAQKALQNIGQSAAQFEGGQLTTGTSPVAEGNAAITANLAAQQGQNISLAEQAALAGNAQGLTAQNQAQSGLTAAGEVANIQQGNEQSGLTSAGTLAQPNTAAFGQTVFNPLTGQYENGGTNLDPQTQAGTLAQQVQSGQITYDQALQSMGYAGAAGTTFLNNAITKAGGNPLQLQAQGSATQSVIGTQASQVAGYQSALNQGQNLQSQLTDLISTFGLNPNDVNAVNSGLQKIAQNISSPQYKILSNYVNDIANTYAQILTPTGGSQTDTTRSLASSMLDATAKGTSIITTMKALDDAAKAKIAGVYTTGTQNTAVTEGNSTGASTSSDLFNW